MTDSARHNQASPAYRSRRPWLIAWILVVSTLIGFIFVSRYQAIDKDHASANLNSTVACLLIWLATVFFLLIARSWRLGLATLCVPILIGVLLSILFRVERVDGELRPHFAFRWTSVEQLPTIKPEVEAAANEALFKARTTDWGQFLGPSRNANADSFSIDTDWQNNPPQEVWRQSIGEGWSGFAVRGDAAITMEQRNDQEWVSAYNIQSGSLVWRYAIDAKHSDPLGGPGPRCTPIIHEDWVIACSAVSQVVCLKLTTGEAVWAKDLNALMGVSPSELLESVNYGRSGSPLVFEKTVIVPLGGKAKTAGSLIALDIHSGDEVWRSGDFQISYASPMLVSMLGSEQILYPTKDDLISCDPRTGKQLWTFHYDGCEEAPNVAQPICIDEQTLFLSKGYGVGARLVDVRKSPTSDSLDSVWEASLQKENRTIMRTKFTNPIYHDQHIYGLSDGILECIEARTLKRKWKGGRYRQGQVVLTKNTLLVSAEDGRVVLVALDHQQHKELAEFQAIRGVTWNPPTLVGDLLLLRNSNEVACFQLNLKDEQL